MREGEDAVRARLRGGKMQEQKEIITLLFSIPVEENRGEQKKKKKKKNKRQGHEGYLAVHAPQLRAAEDLHRQGIHLRQGPRVLRWIAVTALHREAKR